jgi:hypothetical protein
MAEHFVETNIVIGSTVAWDRQSATVEGYLQSITDEVTLWTSARVLDEAEKVVNDRRSAAKQAARRIFDDFDAPNQHPPIEQVINFVRGELSHLRDTVVDHVIQHIKDNEYVYSGLTQIDSRRGLSNTMSDIDSDFDDVIDVLDGIRRQDRPELEYTVFTEIKREYSGYSCYSTVDRLLTDSPNDRAILMDSYHLSKENDLQLVLFITMDSDILDNETELEATLDTIEISHPQSYQLDDAT